MMNVPGASMAKAQIMGPRTKVLGLIPLAIGAPVMLQHRDGSQEQIEVRERARYAKHAEDATVVCIKCRERGAVHEWATLDEMVAAHPTHEAMVKAGEAHPFALWSEAELPSPPVHVDGLPFSPKPGKRIVGLLSDVR